MSRVMPYKRKAAADNTVSKRGRTSYTAAIARGALRGNELKMVDTTTSGVLATLPLTTPGLLNPIGAGDNVNQRDGRRVQLKSLQLKGILFNDSAFKSSVRIVIVYDKQTNSTALTPATFSAGGTYTSFINENLQGRFVTLIDQMWDLDATGTGDSVKTVNIYKPLNQLPTNFSGSNNDVGSIDSGSIYMFVFSSRADTAAVTISTRVKYHDK